MEPREFEVLRTLIACRLACSSTMSAYSGACPPPEHPLPTLLSPSNASENPLTHSLSVSLSRTASKDPQNEYLLLTQEPGWVALENFWRLSEKSALKAFLTTALWSVPEGDQDEWKENFPAEFSGLGKPTDLGAYLEQAQEG